MKAIILNCRDGKRHLAFVVPAAFDTQAWAETRRVSLNLLEVTSITEEYASC
jgi:hypothetical protein